MSSPHLYWSPKCCLWSRHVFNERSLQQFNCLDISLRLSQPTNVFLSHRSIETVLPPVSIAGRQRALREPGTSCYIQVMGWRHLSFNVFLIVLKKSAVCSLFSPYLSLLVLKRLFVLRHLSSKLSLAFCHMLIPVHASLVPDTTAPRGPLAYLCSVWAVKH